MRAKDSAFVALLEGDALDLVSLVSIDLESGPVRLALDAADRAWDGETYSATAGAWDEMQESAEREVPALRLVLQNADGVLGPALDPNAGGEDARGRRVTVAQADRRLLDGGVAADRAIAWEFFVESVAWFGREAVALDLGVFPAALIRVPERTLQGLRCRWRYKGAHCGYAGDLASCAKTRQDCAAHFPGEPLRFGGFPSSADARALRVD